MSITINSLEQQFCILVNENDEQVGIEEKLKTHQKGLLHRAFSVFIFNDNNELLLQKRAIDKYHSPGLWTNTCCSHPQPNESNIQAGERRLQEEMGFTTSLHNVTSFIYKAELENNLVEHELDHILIGNYNAAVNPNALEVSDYRWILLETLQREVDENPELFTVWLKIILDNHLEELKSKIL